MIEQSQHADLLRAQRHLEVIDVVSRGAVAKLLGLERAERIAQTKVQPRAETKLQAPVATSEARTTPTRDQQPRPPQPDEKPYELMVTTLSPQRSLLSDSEYLEGDILEQQHLAPPPPRRSLLKPVWRRALVSAAVSTEQESPTFDLKKLVALMAAGKPIRVIPRKKLQSTRLGVICCIDESLGMEPFAADASAIPDLLREVAGDSLVFQRTFRILPDPLELLSPSPEDPGAPQGAAIVIASDFGLIRFRGRRDWATTTEWLALAASLREMGAGRLIGLTPVPPGRWPASLRKGFELVSWDQGSSNRSLRNRR